jgi:hypothetical protein
MKKIVEVTVKLQFDDIENREDLKRELEALDTILRENDFGWMYSNGWGTRKWEEAYKK